MHWEELSDADAAARPLDGEDDRATGWTPRATRGRAWLAGRAGCRHRAPNIDGRHGRRDRIRPGEGHSRQAPAQRRVLQARAARPDDAVGAQRVRQDHAAADARGRGIGGPRAALDPEGREGGPARPAPSARARPVAARLRALGRGRHHRARARARPPRAGDGRRRARRAHAERLLQGPGALRAARRLPLARPRAGHAARPGFPRGRPRPPAGHLLGRRAHPRARSAARSPASPTCCCSTSPPTTSTSPRWSGWRSTWPASTPP